MARPRARASSTLRYEVPFRQRVQHYVLADRDEVARAFFVVRGIAPGPYGFEADGRAPPRAVRVLGAAALPFPLVGLSLLILAQRHWRRRCLAAARRNDPLAFWTRSPPPASAASGDESGGGR